MTTSKVRVEPQVLTEIAEQPDGLFIFWSFQKSAGWAKLEAIPYLKPSDAIVEFQGAVDRSLYLEEDGRVRRVSAIWPVYELPPQLIEQAAGVRIWLLARDLGPHFPIFACRGWLRVPDGDVPELEKSWEMLKP